MLKENLFFHLYHLSLPKYKNDHSHWTIFFQLQLPVLLDYNQTDVLRKPKICILCYKIEEELLLPTILPEFDFLSLLHFYLWSAYHLNRRHITYREFDFSATRVHENFFSSLKRDVFKDEHNNKIMNLALKAN